MSKPDVGRPWLGCSICRRRRKRRQHPTATLPGPRAYRCGGLGEFLVDVMIIESPLRLNSLIGSSGVIIMIPGGLLANRNLPKSTYRRQPAEVVSPRLGMRGGPIGNWPPGHPIAPPSAVARRVRVAPTLFWPVLGLRTDSRAIVASAALVAML
jgi:hypothetical protein